jgi:hypothetical protein
MRSEGTSGEVMRSRLDPAQVPSDGLSGILPDMVATPARRHRIATLLTLAAWVFALGCTSVYACELDAPMQQHDCCGTTLSIDAQCSTHCAFEGQAPTLGWPDLAQAALAAPVFRVTAPVPSLREHPPPDARGASPPLTILLLRLRN